MPDAIPLPRLGIGNDRPDRILRFTLIPAAFGQLFMLTRVPQHQPIIAALVMTHDRVAAEEALSAPRLVDVARFAD